MASETQALSFYRLVLAQLSLVNFVHLQGLGASLVAQRWGIWLPMKATWVLSLSQEDPLEKKMATHSSILAWEISRTEEPGGLQSLGSQRVGHNWVTNTFVRVWFFWLHWIVCFLQLIKDIFKTNILNFLLGTLQISISLGSVIEELLCSFGVMFHGVFVFREVSCCCLCTWSHHLFRALGEIQLLSDLLGISQ